MAYNLGATGADPLLPDKKNLRRLPGGMRWDPSVRVPYAVVFRAVFEGRWVTVQNIARCVGCAILFLAVAGAGFWPATLLAEPIDFKKYALEAMPSYSGNYVRMTVGLDGRVLLACSQIKANGLLWIVDKDGNSIASVEGMGNTIFNATSNKEGLVAMDVAHVVHSIFFYTPELAPLFTYDDYTQTLRDASLGYENPASVWAGKSGQFYVYDIYASRVVVYTAAGSPKETIPLKGKDYEANRGGGQGVLFPDEANQRLLLVTKGGIYVFDLQGNQTSYSALSLPGPVTMSDEGALYHYNTKFAELEEISATGEILSKVSLPVAESPDDINHPWWWSVAVHQGEIYIRKGHPYELFQRYHLKDGSLIKTVEAKFSLIDPPLE